MQLINNDGSINPHTEFTFQKGKSSGKRLRIIASQDDGFKAIETLDTIKNLDTGKKTELKRFLTKELDPVVVQ